MDLLQILLIVMGLATAAGGGLMLLRASGSGSPRRGYAPLAMIGIGLMVAYRAFSEFKTLDAQDITIMFLFVVALLSLMAVQMFLIDRPNPHAASPNNNDIPDLQEPGKGKL